MVAFLLCELTCSAIAVTARRTLAKVKSSAIRPRQPEVPNLMGEVAIARYSSPEYEGKRSADAAQARDLREGGMVAGKNGRIVLVTCGSIVEARRIASAVVRRKLAACANIVLGPVESIYRWKGKVERAREVLMVVKTSAKRLVELEREVKRLHSYDVAEFVVVGIDA